jgi:cytochrome c peroxidase
VLIVVPPPTLPLDDEISALISLGNLTGDPAAGRNLPSITSPMADLGRLLFFSKLLGGEQDAACVSCHHPMLGGGDNLSLSLSVGVHAVNVFNVTDAELLGIGRHAEVAGGLP